MDKEKVAEAVARAVDAFNSGRYHEALDGFEVPYHEGGRASRDLWLGLIRASAALYHFERGQHLSAKRLHASSREVLARQGSPATLPGGGDRKLDIAALLADLEAVFAPLAAASGEEAAALRPASRPRMRLLG